MERYRLAPASELSVWRAWLDPNAAARVHAELAAELTWEQRSVHIFGRWVPQPRLIAWAGAVPYRYSGLELGAAPLPPRIEALIQAVNEQTQIVFNHVLLNRYRDGNDSMGWHSDDEPELGPDPPVASLSLGASRDFLLRPKHARDSADGKQAMVHKLVLGPGDLLLMAGETQRRFAHSLPKRKNAASERISLTFRRVLRPPGPHSWGAGTAP